MIVKEISKEVAVKTDSPLIAIQILKHVDVLHIVHLTRCVKKDTVACSV
jgi:hypothetical protein